MREADKGRAMSNAFVFLLLGVFAVFGTVLVLICARAYRTTADSTAAHNETRILRSMIRHAVRAEDEAGAVTVQQLGGCDVLCIADGQPGGCTTFLYVHDGMLCELYAREFKAERGESICPAQGMTARVEDGLLRASITAENGEIHDVSVALYAGEGAS